MNAAEQSEWGKRNREGTGEGQISDKMMSILEAANLAAQPPEGAYYVMADFSAWDFDGDDFALARWLPERLGVAVVPGSSFYATPGLGKRAVRFAFAKKLETLNAAGERLSRRLIP